MNSARTLAVEVSGGEVRLRERRRVQLGEQPSLEAFALAARWLVAPQPSPVTSALRTPRVEVRRSRP